MLKRLRFAVVVAAALGAATAAQAEPTGSYFELTPFGGYTYFDGDIRDFVGAPLTDDLYFGGRIGYQMWTYLGFEVAGGFTPTALDVAGGTDFDFMHVSGNAMITPWAGRYGSLFVSLGGGMSKLKPAGGGDELTQGNAEIGLGVKLWLTDGIGLRLEGRNLSWLQKDDVTNPLTQTQIIGGGLAFAFGGRPRDSDGDGVPDRKDQCPDTPAGATVDANGCPKDSDSDQVLDGLDQCPGTPAGATVDARGCPSDADGDGVFDGIDRCADTPKGATVDATGCPRDTDGDGVFDGIDQCPDTQRGATVDERGCGKDSDNDGVPDGIDKCPDTSAGLKVDAEGCPIELIEKETELMDTGMIRLQNVNFETAKADILPESLPVLDVVGQVLTKWPELRIEIGGHTDSRGSNAYNQRLSDARARSVESYLEDKFPTLNKDQFTAKGYGEVKPIAPNNNALNMAKNRRVEFVVLNRDVLRREVERRRLLQKTETSPAPAPTPSPAPAPTPAPADTTRTP